MKKIDFLGNYFSIFQQTSISAFLLVAFWLLSPVALATYTPQPSEPSTTPRTNNGSAGGRTCPHPERQTKKITLFASYSYLNNTALTHPQFSWFVDTYEPVKIRFRLYEKQQDNTLRQIIPEKEWTVSERGIVTHTPTLPNETGLSPNKRYVWQVILFCDADDPTDTTWQQSNFQVVEMPIALSKHLQNTSDRCDRVNLYARSELWYEAIAEALQEKNELGVLGANLLEDLIPLEATQILSAEDPEIIREWVEDIRKIARHARENSTISCD